MLGHISGAYAARVTRDLSLCSRFDFNVYSYESEWTMGAEWWTRRSKTKSQPESFPVEPASQALYVPSGITGSRHDDDDIQGVVKARASTTTVRVRSCACLPCFYERIISVGCLSDVGRPHTKPPCQPGHSLEFIKSSKTN